MARSPFLIVKEFALSPSDQHRRNAATALAMLAADDQSLRELFRLALTDKSPEVLERAEAEIAGLPKERLDMVLTWLRDQVSGGNTPLSAYRMLGHLRQKGIHTSAPPINPIRRVLLAKRYCGLVYPDRNFRFRLRALWPSLVMSMVPWVFFALFLFAIRVDVSLADLGMAISLGILVSTSVSAIAVGFTSPAGLHADPLAAGLLDLGMTFFGAGVISAIVSLLVSSGPIDVASRVSVLLMPVVTALAVRIAMFPIRGLVASRAADRWLQILAGSGAGILTLCIIPAALRTAGKTVPTPNDHGQAVPFLWLVLLPLGLGLAAAFSRIDAQAASVPPTRRFWRTLAFAPAAAVILALLLLAIPPVRYVDSLPTISDDGTPDQRHRIEIHSLPATLKFIAAGQDPIRLESPSVSHVTLDGNYRYLPWSSVVEAGTHSIVLDGPTERDKEMRILPTLLARLSPASIRGRLLRERPQPKVLATIDLTLHAETNQPPQPINAPYSPSHLDKVRNKPAK